MTQILWFCQVKNVERSRISNKPDQSDYFVVSTIIAMCAIPPFISWMIFVQKWFILVDRGRGTILPMMLKNPSFY